MPKELTEAQLSRIELLRQRSMEPFVALLDRILEAEPPKPRLDKWAAERPGEWASMAKTVANLAGYSDQREVRHTGVLAHVHAMSDAELLDTLKRFSHASGATLDAESGGTSIEGEAVRVLPDNDTT